MEVCRHFAAKPLNRMQRVSPIRYNILYVMDTFSIDRFTCHERKPRLHDGTVTEDMDKYRLVRIPPSGREPPDVG